MVRISGGVSLSIRRLGPLSPGILMTGAGKGKCKGKCKGKDKGKGEGKGKQRDNRFLTRSVDLVLYCISAAPHHVSPDYL